MKNRSATDIRNSLLYFNKTLKKAKCKIEKIKYFEASKLSKRYRKGINSATLAQKLQMILYLRTSYKELHEQNKYYTDNC